VTRLESDYYDYMGYDPENSKAGLRHYLPWFPDGPVIELACGRGEFLELLRDAGVAAEGIDVDEGMVARARADGHTVQLADALTGLRSREAGSARGVFSAHFAEHLQPDDLEAVVQESARVLAPGGHFIAATPNAASVSVMGHDFWRDPTHVRFYEPRLLAFYCAKAGLEVVETGGNPLNAPGPPPHVLAPAVHVDADLRPDLALAIQRITDPKSKGKADPESPWHVFGHFLAVLEERLRVTQEELASVRRSYAHLLDALYPPNEVYVVARAV
jgi:SAM-dependent methyltransferase